MEMNKMVGGREGEMHAGEREAMGGHAHSHPRQAEHSPTYPQQEMQDKQKKGKLCAFNILKKSFVSSFPPSNYFFKYYKQTTIMFFII